MDNFTDAEFRIVQGYRVGDPHPLEPGWRYAGVGVFGQEMWWRPPRFSRMQLIPLVIGAALAAWVLFAVVVWAIQGPRSY